MQFDCIQSLWNTKQLVLLLWLLKNAIYDFEEGNPRVLCLCCNHLRFLCKAVDGNLQIVLKVVCTRSREVNTDCDCALQRMQRGEMHDTVGKGLDAEGLSASNVCFCRIQHYLAFLLAIMLHDSAWFCFHACCKQFQRTTNYELVIVNFVSKNTFLLLAVWLMTFIDSQHQRFVKFFQDGCWVVLKTHNPLELIANDCLNQCKWICAYLNKKSVSLSY